MPDTHGAGKSRRLREALWYLQTVGKVNVIVTTQTTKVRDETLTGFHAVVVKGPTLPLGQTERHFELDVLEVPGSKGSRALDTIEVVVKARLLGQEERARYALEVDVLLEFAFEGGLDELQSFFLSQKVLEDGGVLVHDFFGRETSQRVFGIESSSHGRRLKETKSNWFLGKINFMNISESKRSTTETKNVKRTQKCNLVV